MAALIPPGGWIIIGVGLGLIAGSYLATIVLRWPQGQAARGRSRCDGCGVTLGPGDLIPLLSFLMRRGRCGHCAAWIDQTHSALEAMAALIGAASLAAAPGIAGLALASFGWLLLALAALDLVHFWLPDRLTVTLALLGLAGGIGGIGGLPPALIDRLIGGGAGFGLLAAIAWGYRGLRGREGMGRGDPKLFGAIGLWVGWQALPFVLLGASTAGLAALLALRLSGRPITITTRVPFGTLLALAGWGVALMQVMTIPS